MHEKALDNFFDLKAAKLMQLYIKRKSNKGEKKTKKISARVSPYLGQRHPIFAI